jgi:hypothetical protein
MYLRVVYRFHLNLTKFYQALLIPLSLDYVRILLVYLSSTRRSCPLRL